MKLLVIRHAEAEDRDPGRWPDDSLRPLSGKGIEQFRKSAAGLRKLASPETLLTSPYLRARQTADILHKVAEWPAPEEAEELAGNTPGVARLIEQKTLQSPGGTMAVVGHQPTLSELISTISAGHHRSGIQMKPGAVALLDVTAVAAELTGTLLWLAQPGLTRLMA